MNDQAEPTRPETALPSWDALPGMLLVLDAGAAARVANSALAAFAGRAEAELLGAGWRNLFTDAALEEIDRRLDLGADFHCRLEVRRADGRYGWVDCWARWLSERRHCACLLTDVTAGELAQASAQAQAGLFGLLADNVPVLIAYFRRSDLTCQFANRAYARTFGFEPHQVIGRSVAEVIGERVARDIQPYVDIVINEGRAVQYERQLNAADGSARTIEVNLLPHADEHAEVIGAFVLISDITRHRAAERVVRESEERLAKFMQASVEGIVFHKAGVIVDVNPPICTLTGFSPSEMVGRRTVEFVAPDEVAKVLSVIASGQETSYESVIVDKHGQRIPVEFIVRAMTRNGERLRMTIVRDLRDRHAAQARIHHLAHHDVLTGLPNRMSFMGQIEAHIGALRHAAEAGGGDGAGAFALLFIDLDHFKRVNDSLGHLAGDTLLRTAATRIVASLRATDIVARFGGDEFMVLLTGIGGGGQRRRQVEEVAGKLLRAIDAPLAVDGRPISVTSSIGIAMYPDDGATPDELFKHADTAMYEAKSRGRANYRFFERELAGSAYAALVVEGELAHALERGEFVLHFQPQVSTRDGRVVCAEALLRWNHPTRGLLSPDEFVPVAERQRLMLAIGRWVFGEAIAAALRWRARGLGELPVAVNLSSVQFESDGFVDSVAALLPVGATGLLELEITERMLLDELPDLSERLLRLRALGVHLSVDDFGTGHSSLVRLKHLPIDKLKLDHSFVADLPGNADSAAIARAIIQLGRSLDLTVVAEGVETDAQQHFLAEHGADALQGLRFAPPLPAEAFEDWLAAWHGGGASGGAAR